MTLPHRDSKTSVDFSRQKSTIILGCGGHARVLISTLEEQQFLLNGTVDPGYSVGTKTSEGLIVRGRELIELAEHFPPTRCQLVNGIGYLGTHDRRRLQFLKAQEFGYRFPIILHPAVVIGRNCHLEQGVQLMAGVVIQNNVTLDQNSIVNTSASIDHDCHIAAHSHIAPGVHLAGNVRVGEHSLIGIGSTIVQGVSIGSNSIVGAGSVVLHSIPDNVVAVGNPAQVIRKK